MTPTRNLRLPALAGPAAAVLVALAMAAPVHSLAQVANPNANVGLREGVAAIVEDEIISTYDLRQRAIWIMLNTGIQPTADNLPQLQREALRSLIDERLEEHELRRQEDERKLDPGTLFASDEDVDRYLTNMAQQNNLSKDQFIGELNARGIATKSIRDQARIAISWQQWIVNFYGRQVRISDDQIEATMKELQTAADSPSYQIGEIFISNENAGGAQNAAATANQIIAQLQQNGRFEPLARQFSALPTAANGGDAGWTSGDDFPPQVKQVIDQLRPGQVSRPIQTDTGVFIILLRDKRAGSEQTLVTLKQVAVPLAANADDNAVAKAQQQLLAVKTRLNGCSNLEQVAEQAGLRVGDLGQADPKDLAPEFRDAVQTLKANEVSDPIRTTVGLHLVAVCGRASADSALPTRDDIRDQLFAEQVSMLERRELRNLRNASTISQPQ